MRQFTFILFYLLWHAHDGSVLAAFSCMHFLYPTCSLATFSPNNNKISGHNANHTWLIKSSPLEKTTYVHASNTWTSSHVNSIYLHATGKCILASRLVLHPSTPTTDCPTIQITSDLPKSGVNMKKGQFGPKFFINTSKLSGQSGERGQNSGGVGSL